MAAEIIEAIRQAETQAAEAKQAAEQEARQILQNAQEYSAFLKEQKTREARARVDQAMAEAEEQCRRMLQDAKAQEDAEIQTLKQTAASRRPQAVEAVLSQLLGNA